MQQHPRAAFARLVECPGQTFCLEPQLTNIDCLGSAAHQESNIFVLLAAPRLKESSPEGLVARSRKFHHADIFWVLAHRLEQDIPEEVRIAIEVTLYTLAK